MLKSKIHFCEVILLFLDLGSSFGMTFHFFHGGCRHFNLVLQIYVRLKMHAYFENNHQKQI